MIVDSQIKAKVTFKVTRNVGTPEEYVEEFSTEDIIENPSLVARLKGAFELFKQTVKGS